MEIAKNDMMMHAIHNELIRKRKEIVNKYKLLRDKIQDNKLLVDVLEDYEGYCNRLVLNKRQQIDKLTSLTHHLDKINQESDNVDRVLKSTNDDYRILMSEISRIKKDLDEYGI
tara:strand:- start:1759 stop:2100 length:342 start_codon:yes stop_codon:yes gene_type:complete